MSGGAPRTGLGPTAGAALLWLGMLGLSVFAVVEGGAQLWVFEPGRWVPALALGFVFLFWMKGRKARVPRSPGAIQSALACPTWRVDLVFLVLGFGLCWFLRDNSRSGDFGRVMSDILGGVDLIAAEPISPWMMGRLADLVRVFGDLKVAALQFTLCAWGALGIVLLRRVAIELADDRLEDVPLVFAVLLSTGANALLLAHVETYTFSGVCMLAALMFALRHVKGQGPFFPAMVAWTLACAFHMQMLVLGPAMATLTLWAWQDRKERQRHLLAWLLWAMVLVGLQKLCAANPTPYPQHFGGGDGTMLVPAALWFSQGHLMAVAKELGLVAPTLLATLVAFGVGWRGSDLRGRPGSRRVAMGSFLALALGGWFALLFFWNPDLGAWHDWDLFAGLGWATSAWACARVLSSEEVDRRWWLAALAGLSAARLVPFVWANHLGPVVGLG